MSDKLNLIDTLKQHDKFSTFTRLMASSGTNEVISASGDFTVFVPTNDAFSKIPEARIDELLNETGQTKLKTLLSYHIMSGKVMAQSLVSAPTRKAFTGEALMFTDINGLKVNGASIQARNLEATNGVIHALESVLTPTSAPKAAAASTTPRAAAETAPLVTPTAIGSSGFGALPTPISPTPTSNGSTVPAAATPDTARAETKSIL